MLMLTDQEKELTLLKERLLDMGSRAGIGAQQFDDEIGCRGRLELRPQFRIGSRKGHRIHQRAEVEAGPPGNHDRRATLPQGVEHSRQRSCVHAEHDSFWFDRAITRPGANRRNDDDIDRRQWRPADRRMAARGDNI